MAIDRMIALLICLFTIPATMANHSLAVIYPEIDTTDNLLFSEILVGIRAHHSQEILIKAINNNEPPEEAVEWVQLQKPEMIIALGKSGFRAAKRLPANASLVIGALPIRPGGMNGISLLADPKTQFDYLQKLAPNILKVHVIYSSGNRWLVNIAADYSATLALKLNSIEVKNIKDAVNQYDVLLKKIDSNSEAIWLLEDTITTHEQVILPNLLEVSWEKQIVLFSGKPELAKRGALFSLIPDYEELGGELVNKVNSMHETKIPTGVTPLQSVKIAVNLRTASHLNYHYSPLQLSQFHVTFPE